MNDADRGLGEHADVVEVTGMFNLSRWTTTCPGMRVIVRREHPHPGATLNAYEIRDDYRYQAFTINLPGGQLAFLDARQRAHARVEERIRTGKDTGIGHLPSRHAHVNEVWVELALIAAYLLVLAQSMLQTDEPDLHRAEPNPPATGSCRWVTASTTAPQPHHDHADLGPCAGTSDSPVLNPKLL